MSTHPATDNVRLIRGLTLLAALAREVDRVDIGVLVYGNTHRHPAMLAKEIVTIDHVTKDK